MSEVSIEKLKTIYAQFPWDSREDYRVLRKVRPDFDLPSDTIISKKWGSFSKFKDVIRGDVEEYNLDNIKSDMLLSVVQTKEPEPEPEPESIEPKVVCDKNLDIETNTGDIISNELKEELKSIEREELDKNAKNELIQNGFVHIGHTEGTELQGVKHQDAPELNEEEKIVCEVRSVCGVDFTRKQYREIRKNNPNLPSCNHIQKIFGSFGKMKTIVKESSASIEEEIKPEEVSVSLEKMRDTNEGFKASLVEDEITPEENAIRLARVFWPNGEDFTRNEYRERRKQETDVELPSSDRISKMFGSFSSFKNKVLEDFASSFTPGDGWNPTFEEIEQMRAKVQAKRQVLFGSRREPYDWEPKGRGRKLLKQGILGFL